MDPLATDDRFFAALLAGNTEELERVLGEDFVLIDVMQGSEIPRAALLAAVGAQMVRFEAITPVERRVRQYRGTAIVTGRTQMKGRFGENRFSTHSRYTHVFIEQEANWRLVSAQGTPIQAE